MNQPPDIDMPFFDLELPDPSALKGGYALPGMAIHLRRDQHLVRNPFAPEQGPDKPSYTKRS